MSKLRLLVTIIDTKMVDSEQFNPRNILGLKIKDDVWLDVPVILGC